MSLKRRLKRLVAQSVHGLSVGLEAEIAKSWADSNPGQHQLLYEQVHLRRLLSLLDVDCVFDVGANSGQYAEMLREKAGYTGLIISFEPIPDLANTLRQRAADDPLWLIQQVALSSKSAPAQFSIMASDRFSSLANPKHDETNWFSDMNQPIRKIDLVTQTLENVYADLASRFNFNKPFLKMDTQGFDLEVAKGGESLLNKFVGLQSELAIVGLYDGAPKMSQVISEFDRMGFGLSALVPNTPGHFPALVEIDGIFVRKDLLKL